MSVVHSNTRATPHEPHRLTLAASTLGILVAVALAWSVIDLLLLLFAAVLVAQLLLACTDALSRWTGLSHAWSLAVTCFAVIGLLALGGVLLAPSLADQVRALRQSLPTSLDHARTQLHASPVGDWLGGILPTADELRSATRRAVSGIGDLRRVTGIITTAVGATTSVGLVFLLGVFFAAQPRTYREGAVRLVPPERRERAREVLGRIGHALRWWLLGKSLSMVVAGTLSALGLWLLGIPLALTLGLLAALLSFIPNFGPVLALVPAALIGLTQSAASAGQVVLLYVGVQAIESWVLTPLIQRRALSLPPGLILGTQMIIGGLLGVLGLALATPMLAVVVVLTQALYVEDVLHDA